MSERDYMAEFNEASSRSRDILIEAGGHINYLRSLLRDLLPFLPKNHPWLPGINEQIEALPVDERDATIAALQAELAHKERYWSQFDHIPKPPSGEPSLPKIKVNGDAGDLGIDLNAGCWTALDVGEHSAAILVATTFSDYSGGGLTKYGQAVIRALTRMNGETSAEQPRAKNPTETFRNRVLAHLNEACGHSENWSKYDCAVLDLASEADGAIDFLSAELAQASARIDAPAIAASPELADKKALVLYFETDEDRDGMIAACREAMPTARTVKVP